MYCSNCGKIVKIDDKYCGSCGTSIKKDFERVDIEYQEVVETETRDIVNYNKPLLITSILSVVLIFLAFDIIVMWIGASIGIISLFMIIYVLIKNKKENVYNKINKYTLMLSIVGLISNSIWLVFTIFILPYIK